MRVLIHRPCTATSRGAFLPERSLLWCQRSSDDGSDLSVQIDRHRSTDTDRVDFLRLDRVSVLFVGVVRHAVSEHLLVPMDGSPLAGRALEVALDEHPDARIDVIHVIDPTEPGYSYLPFDRTAELETEPRHGSEAWYDRAREFADELFEDAREMAAERAGQIETELVVGSPGREIVDYVAEHGVDHVVIGSHGRGEPDQPLLGSVTEAVVFRSPVRVSLIR